MNLENESRCNRTICDIMADIPVQTLSSMMVENVQFWFQSKVLDMFLIEFSRT